MIKTLEEGKTVTSCNKNVWLSQQAMTACSILIAKRIVQQYDHTYLSCNKLKIYVVDLRFTIGIVRSTHGHLC